MATYPKITMSFENEAGKTFSVDIPEPKFPYDKTKVHAFGSALGAVTDGYEYTQFTAVGDATVEAAD